MYNIISSCYDNVYKIEYSMLFYKAILRMLNVKVTLSYYQLMRLIFFLEYIRFFDMVVTA